MKELQRKFRREWHLLCTDAWLASLVSWVPLLLFFLLWWIFSAGLPRDLAIGVVDFDNSDLSRTLVRQYDASPGLQVASRFGSVGLGTAAMRSGKINALIVVPYNLKSDALAGRTPQVTAFYNSQFLLIGKLIASALQSAHGTFDVELSIVKGMSKGLVGVQALGTAVPVSAQITALFNINTDYARFLASAAIPAIWQILIVLTTMLALSREIRLKGLAAWLGERPLTAILGKLLPYTLLLWLQGAFFLCFMYVWLGWPMHGSWGVLLVSQLLMVLASQSVALLLFLLVKDPARALSLAAGYTAPSFAFMGVTFPATDMSVAALIWRDLLPVSHYMQIHLYQANHGASLQAVLPVMGALLLFLLTFPLAWLLARRKLSAAPIQEFPT